MAVLLGGVKKYKECLKKEFHKLKPKRKYSPKQKVAIALNECRPML